MIESFDFTLGIVLGVILTFAGNYLTEKWRESRELKGIARALITELKGVKEAFSKYQSHKTKITIFSTNIPKLILFKKQTIDAILKTYHEINWGLVGSLKTNDVNKLMGQIDNTIEIIEKELDC